MTLPADEFPFGATCRDARMNDAELREVIARVRADCENPVLGRSEEFDVGFRSCQRKILAILDGEVEY